MQFAAPTFEPYYGWLWLIGAVSVVLSVVALYLTTRKDGLKDALIFSTVVGSLIAVLVVISTWFFLTIRAESSYSREVASKIESLAPVTVLDSDREKLTSHTGSYVKEINLVANKSTTALECRVLFAKTQYTITCKKPSSEDYVSVEEALAHL